MTVFRDTEEGVVSAIVSLDAAISSSPPVTPPLSEGPPSDEKGRCISVTHVALLALIPPERKRQRDEPAAQVPSPKRCRHEPEESILEVVKREMAQWLDAWAIGMKEALVGETNRFILTHGVSAFKRELLAAHAQMTAIQLLREHKAILTQRQGQLRTKGARAACQQGVIGVDAFLGRLEHELLRAATPTLSESP